MLEKLTSNEAFDQLIQEDEPVWVFKHSTACPVAASAYGEFQRYMDEHPQEKAGLVVVQTHRPVSNYIAQKLNHTHQTPQLFLVRGEEVLWQASHMHIKQAAMRQARQEHAHEE